VGLKQVLFAYLVFPFQLNEADFGESKNRIAETSGILKTGCGIENPS
jgi:hypothetical protein